MLQGPKLCVLPSDAAEGQGNDVLCLGFLPSCPPPPAALVLLIALCLAHPLAWLPPAWWPPRPSLAFPDTWEDAAGHALCPWAQAAGFLDVWGGGEGLVWDPTAIIPPPASDGVFRAPPPASVHQLGTASAGCIAHPACGPGMPASEQHLNFPWAHLVAALSTAGTGHMRGCTRPAPGSWRQPGVKRLVAMARFSARLS